MNEKLCLRQSTELVSWLKYSHDSLLSNILIKLVSDFKKLKDCHVPAIGKMNGCWTTAYLATYYLGTRWWRH